MKKRYLIVFTAMILVCSVLGLAACDGTMPVKNAEFEEYEKIMLSVKENSLDKFQQSPKAQSSRNYPNAAGAQQMAFTNDTKTDLFDVINNYSDSILPIEDETYLGGMFKSIFDVSMNLPLVAGDCLRTYSRVEKFYGIIMSCGISDNDLQVQQTTSNGTHKITKIVFSGANNVNNYKDYVQFDIDYKSAEDFSFVIYEESKNMSLQTFYYGNSDLDFFVLSKSTMENGEGFVLFKKNASQGEFRLAEAVTESYNIVKDGFDSMDIQGMESMCTKVDYNYTDEQWSKSAEKYPFYAYASAQESGWEIKDGIVLGWRQGRDDAPSELTLPGNANALFYELGLPENVTTLIIPANITSVKQDGYGAYQDAMDDWQANGEQGKEPQPEDYQSAGYTTCAADKFFINMHSQDGERKIIQNIKLEGKSNLFKITDGALYTTEGNLVYVPINNTIRDLVVDARPLSGSVAANLMSATLPLLKNIDITFADSDLGYDDVLTAISRNEKASYNLDSIILRAEYLDDISLPDGSIKSVKEISIYADKQNIEYRNDLEINTVIDKLTIAKAPGMSLSFRQDLDGKIKEISIPQDIKTIYVYGNDSESIRMLLPWSQLEFMLEQKYKVFRENMSEYDYEQLDWGYDSAEHYWKNENLTLVFQPLTELDKIELKKLSDFKAYHIYKDGEGSFDYDCISINGYYGSDKVINVPETMLGYPVVDFTLKNSGSSSSIGNPTVGGVTELHLSNTLKVFDTVIWEGSQYEQYALDKIVYNGTKEQFLKLLHPNNQDFAMNYVYEILTYTGQIVCNDGSFTKDLRSEVQYEFAISENAELTVCVDWEARSMQFELRIGTEVVNAHIVGPAHSSQNSWDFEAITFIDELGNTCDVNSLTIIMNSKNNIDGTTSHWCTASLTNTNTTTSNKAFTLVSSADYYGPAIAHDYEIVIAEHPATCTMYGSQNLKCLYCEAYKQEIGGSPLGHEYGEWYSVDATCTTVAHERRDCNRCAEFETTNHTATLPHSYTITVEEQLSTCAVKGYRTSQCETCTATATVTLELTDNHTFGENDFCTVCLISHRYLVYIKNDAEYIVTGIKDKSITNIIIPNGVTSIRDSAFANCDKLINIVIPDSVATIGFNAFIGCTNISSVYYTGDIASWCSIDLSGYDSNPLHAGAALYVNDTLVEQLVIPDGVTTIGHYAFYNCASITGVTIPDSVTEIERVAFYNCKGITSVTIGNGVTAIDREAFSGCSGLASVTIGNGVTTIDFGAFYGCTNISSVYYTGDIASWCSIGLSGYDSNPLHAGAALYIKDTLVEHLVIPDGVTIIGHYAFYNCASITGVTIPDGVTTIGHGTFFGCSNLVEMTIPFAGNHFDGNDNTYFGYIFGASNSSSQSSCIPNSLKSVTITSATKIDAGAFSGCSTLVNITLPFAGNSIDGNSNTHFGYIFGASDSYLQSSHIPNSLKSVTITSATKIDAGAFSYCYNLTSVILPAGVTTIGNNAFLVCGGLTSITIPDSVKSIGNGAFSDCYGLTSITIPDSVTSIGDSAFSNCTNLASIIIPDSVTTIGEETFIRCINLTNVTVGNGVTTIGSGAFTYCENLDSITIGNSVTSIGIDAFLHCEKLTTVYYTGDIKGWCSIEIQEWWATPLHNGASLYLNGALLEHLVIPDGVTTIEDWFSKCTSIISVTIPDSVTVIGYYAFSGCSSLTNIIIPDSVTVIDGGAFSDCSSLTSIAIPDGVTDIGGGAFSGCSSLTSIAIPDSVTSIDHNTFSYCSRLTGIMIPSGVTSIGEYAFGGCSSLTGIALPNGVTTIGVSAFSDCSSITGITIPDSVMTIGYGTFYGCNSLIDITLPFVGNSNDKTHFGYIFGARGDDYLERWSVPSSLRRVTITSATTIGGSAFYGCSSLTSIVIPNTVTTIGENAFRDCDNLAEISIPFVGNRIEGDSSAHFSDIFGGKNYVPHSLTSVAITGATTIGYKAFDGCSGLTNVTVGDSVTTIGYEAFYDCSALTSITIGNSVTTIGERAFYGSTRIFDVYYNGDIAGWCNILFNSNPLHGAALYINDTLVEQLVIPDSVTIIGSQFRGCTSIKSVIIPDSVQTIEQNAFYGCGSLTDVTIGNSVAMIEQNAFYNCSGLTGVTIPDSVTTIGYRSFSGCSNLVEMTIPFAGNRFDGNIDTHFGYIFGASDSSLQSSCIPTSLKSVTLTSATKIDVGAFNGCSGLTSVTIGDSVITIDIEAFNGCTGISSVYYTGDIASWCSIDFFQPSSNPTYNGAALYINDTLVEQLIIPDNVAAIGVYAFANCTSITSVTIPDSVTTIGGGAFSGCSNLVEMTIPFAGNSIDDNGHFGHIFFAGYSGYYNIPNSLKVVNITRATAIGDKAFYDCSGLTSITIPDSVTTIGFDAFSGCSGLTSVTIPDSVTTIGVGAFSGCSGLTGVTIPDSVTTIGYRSFSGCSNLVEMTIPFAGNRFDGNNDTHFGYIFGASNSSSQSSCIPTSLKVVNITSATKIDSGAFNGCSSLTNITIPGNVTFIGSFAFSDCSSLTSVTISDGVTTIYSDAFYGCGSLTSIAIPGSVTSIDDDAFEGTGIWNNTVDNSVVYADKWAVGYKGSITTSVELRSDTVGISSSAFYGCSSLNSIKIPNSVTNIGVRAFDLTGIWQNATFNSVVYADKWAIGVRGGVTKVELRANTVGIGDGAFNGYSGLTSISIPSSVTGIGDYAFQGCSKLTNIFYKGTKNQWGKISKQSYWDNGTGNYTITCTDGTINKI